jgi:hypothetical protein
MAYVDDALSWFTWPVNCATVMGVQPFLANNAFTLARYGRSSADPRQ